jgi:hypothetical protein
MFSTPKSSSTRPTSRTFVPSSFVADQTAVFDNYQPNESLGERCFPEYQPFDFDDEQPQDENLRTVSGVDVSGYIVFASKKMLIIHFVEWPYCFNVTTTAVAVTKHCE